MHRHTLTDAELASLGAGRPSPATIAELRRAQLSKHLLLLRAILQATPKAIAPYGHLTALQHTSPSAVQAVLADPLTGAWATACLKSLRAGHPAGVDHLAALGTPSVARTLRARAGGLEIAVRLEDTDPTRALLGLTPTGRLTDGDAARWQRCLTEAWELLVARHRPDAEVLAAVLQVIVPVQPDPAAHGISATSADAFGAVAMSAPADGTDLAVGLLHETQHSILNAVHYLFDLHTGPVALGYSPWRDDPRPAAGILHGAYAYLAVTRFWRAESAADPANRLAAFEYARWREAVTTATEILLTPSRNPAATLPKSPPAGLTATSEPAPTTTGRTAASRLRTPAPPGPTSANEPPTPARTGLTDVGVRLVSALRDEVGSWLAEPVDPEVARLAAGANADHRLRWDLRNRVVDPNTAETLAAAWLSGAPAPAVASSRLIPAPRRALENSTRLDLTHRLLSSPGAGASRSAGTEPHPQRTSGTAPGPTASAAPPTSQPHFTGPGPEPQPGAGPEERAGWGGFGVRVSGSPAGSRVTAGDDAYLRGDDSAAVRAYRERVVEEPGDDAAWAGLALVSTGGVGSVEVVAAVFRAARRQAPERELDPLALARWVSGR